MKTKRLRSPVSTYVFSIVFLFLTSCNMIILNGNLGTSESIQESKNRQVFIQEYRVPINPYKINDSISIPVKSAWLEHRWRFEGVFSQNAKINDGYQLVIVADTATFRNYASKWMIGTMKGEYFANTAAQGLIVSDLEEQPSSDTLYWTVQDSDNISTSIPPNIIGQFSLIKK